MSPKVGPEICAIPRETRLPSAPRATFSHRFLIKIPKKGVPGARIREIRVSGLKSGDFTHFRPLLSPKRVFRESPLGKHLFGRLRAIVGQMP